MPRDPVRYIFINLSNLGLITTATPDILGATFVDRVSAAAGIGTALAAGFDRFAETCNVQLLLQVFNKRALRMIHL